MQPFLNIDISKTDRDRSLTPLFINPSLMLKVLFQSNLHLISTNHSTRFSHYTHSLGTLDVFCHRSVRRRIERIKHSSLRMFARWRNSQITGYIISLFSFYFTDVYESLNSNLFMWPSDCLVACCVHIPGDYTGLQLCIFYKNLSDFMVQDHHCSGHCRPSAHSYTAKHLGLRWGSSKVGLVNLTILWTVVSTSIAAVLDV